MPTAPKPHKPHGNRARREYDHRRGNANDRGYDVWWSKAKVYHLAMEIANTGNTLCRYCDRNEATTLDHAIPPTRLYVVGSPEYLMMFRDTSLWIPVCGRCNSDKSDLLPNEYRARYPAQYARMVAVLNERGLMVEGTRVVPKLDGVVRAM